MAANHKLYELSTKYFMDINRGYYVIYLQNIKFARLILWTERAYTDDAYATTAVITIRYYDSLHESRLYRLIMAKPNEPKTNKMQLQQPLGKILYLAKLCFCFQFKFLWFIPHVCLPSLKLDFYTGQNILTQTIPLLSNQCINCPLANLPACLPPNLLPRQVALVNLPACLPPKLPAYQPSTTPSCFGQKYLLSLNVLFYFK